MAFHITSQHIERFASALRQLARKCECIWSAKAKCAEGQATDRERSQYAELSAVRAPNFLYL